MKLTEKQDIVLRFMHQFYLDQDTLPPMQTMADVFEWASANTAYCMLQCLVKHGAIERNIIGKYKFTKPGKEYCAKRSADLLPDNAVVSGAVGIQSTES